jgi:hypothetical protein
VGKRNFDTTIGGLLSPTLILTTGHWYSKRQRAEGRRQKGKDWLVKVSSFIFVLIALATAITAHCKR